MTVLPWIGSRRGGPQTDGDWRMSDDRLLGAILLALHTIAAVVALPFSVVLALYAPMYVGGQTRADSPQVVLVTFILLVLPLLLLVGPIGAWVSWVRRRVRAVWIFALLPIVYGGLVLTALSVFFG